jgi:hypothetical protein
MKEETLWLIKEIQSIIKVHEAKLLENLEETDKFLNTCNLPIL